MKTNTKRISHKEVSVLIILVFILVVNIVCSVYPISGINKIKKLQELKVHDIISDVEDNDYVTRIEFLESLLRSIGMTDSVIEAYQKMTIEGVIVDELANVDKYYYIFGNECKEVKDKIYKYENVHDINEEILIYERLCMMAADNNCLQVYNVDDENHFSDYEFRGSDYITINEAITMMQACLNDIETNNGRFNKNSFTYNLLYIKSHFSGILLPIDSIYWSFIDKNLNRNDMAVLLNRLLYKKRYKYITEPIFGEREICGIDNEHSMTYYEYLNNK